MNTKRKPEIYAGTAGWSYKDWVPSFYPKTQGNGFDMLTFYADYFNAVEVNTTYYVYPPPGMLEGWLRKTEEKNDFLFTVKLHSDFTHKRKFGKQQIQAFTYNIEILKSEGKLGGILLQFPYSFGYTPANVEYMRRLFGELEGYDKFVEVRHSSWDRDEFYEFLKKENVTFCTIDQPGLGEAIEFEPRITNDTAYIRFHGRNEEAWRTSIKNFGKKQTYEEQSSRYKYLYSPGELSEIDRKLKEIFHKVRRIFIIMNNHPAGYAVANTFELLNFLKDQNKMTIPETTASAFPRLVKIAG